MWLPVSTLAAVFVLFDISDGMRSENDLEVVFKERTHSDWRNAWHQEKHSRCRGDLVKHLFWACEKDIYQLTRRSEPPHKTYDDYDEDIDINFPWKAPSEAKRFLRFRRNVLDRRSGSSITNECCKSSGCTWEEYAEYCPTNKRYNSYV